VCQPVKCSGGSQPSVDWTERLNCCLFCRNRVLLPPREDFGMVFTLVEHLYETLFFICAVSLKSKEVWRKKNDLGHRLCLRQKTWKHSRLPLYPNL
jgi:hypothetical protein